jgi:hypothetical protein
MVGMFILISSAIMDVAILIFSAIYGYINIFVSALLAYRAGRKPRLFFIPYLLFNAVCSFFLFQLLAIPLRVLASRMLSGPAHDPHYGVPLDLSVPFIIVNVIGLLAFFISYAVSRRNHNTPSLIGR